MVGWDRRCQEKPVAIAEVKMIKPRSPSRIGCGVDETSK